MLFDFFYGEIFLNIFKLSYFFVYKYIEKGIFEYFGPVLISFTLSNI
jgi:hypothetical protein